MRVCRRCEIRGGREKDILGTFIIHVFVERVIAVLLVGLNPNTY